MLLCDNMTKFNELKDKIERLISGISNEGARRILDGYFKEAVDQRCLLQVDHLTHRYTSQSIVESLFAVLKKVNIDTSRRVGDVVRSLSFYLENSGIRRNASESKGMCTDVVIPTELNDTYVQLTDFCFFSLFLPEYASASSYEPRYDVEHDEYHVGRRGLSSTNSYRTVRLASDGSVTCSCNFPVYRGLPCRHTIAALTSSAGSFVFSPCSFNTMWIRNQPAISFRNNSPYTFEWQRSPATLSSESSDEDAAPRSTHRSKRRAATSSVVEAPERPRKRVVLTSPSESSDEDAAPRSTHRSKRRAATSSVVEAPERPRKRVVLEQRTARPGSLPPSAANSDLRHYAMNIVDRAGHNPQLIQALQGCFSAIETSLLQPRDDDLISTQYAEPRSGQPQQRRLGGAKRHKKQYRCSRCGQLGHTKNRCRIRLSPPEATDDDEDDSHADLKDEEDGAADRDNDDDDDDEGLAGHGAERHKKQHRCSRCGQLGHTKNRCRIRLSVSYPGDSINCLSQ
eukprot:GHVU01006105.1.p1 GENE.GHVU01006105.1~~GHVU01006105.1.p1  ORF type:complete len:512 (+),score=30.43 GHVU01006105.1:257-1792(+)